MPTSYVQNATVLPEDLAQFSAGTNLPLVFLNTFAQPVPDDPRITAKLGIIHNQQGLNLIPDIISESSFNNASFTIGIETSGSSSLVYKKKGYRIELKNQTAIDVALEKSNQTLSQLDINKPIVVDGTEYTFDLNAPVLGMPEEEDWTMKGTYVDKTHLRNRLAYEMSTRMGAAYAPRTRVTEAFITQADSDNPTAYQYYGIYVMTETIKRGVDRVNINKLKSSEGPLEGGFLLAIDNVKGVRNEGWFTKNPSSSVGAKDSFPLKVEILYQDPKPGKITSLQQGYIQTYINDFETALKNKASFRQYINEDSFVDYFLFTELTKNPDGYRHSTYFYKDKGADSKLTMGPVWDYNLAFGNTYVCNGNSMSGWQFVCGEDQPPADGLPVPFWWRALTEDADFRTKLATRWTELRAENMPFSMTSIRTYVTEEADTLKSGGAVVRNEKKWNVLGNHVSPGVHSEQPLPENPTDAQINAAYDSVTSQLLSNIEERINWLDRNLPSEGNSFMLQNVPDYSASSNSAMSGAESSMLVVPLVLAVAILSLF